MVWGVTDVDLLNETNMGDQQQGGHFAAFDEPAAFLQDIEDFVEIVKGKVEF